MNVNASALGSGLVWLACVVIAPPALAQKLGEFLNDPLGLIPERLQQGPVLPGEDASFTCAAAPDINQAMRLPELIDLALCNNPSIGLSLAAIRNQITLLGDAQMAYVPALALTTSNQSSTTRYPDSALSSSRRHGQSYGASLNWRLYDFGLRSTNVDAAQRSVQGTIKSHQASIQKVMTAVLNAYFEAQSAHSMIEMRRQAVLRAEQTDQAVMRRLRLGLASQGDLSQSRSALSRAQLMHDRAVGEHRLALAALRGAIGLPPSSQPWLQPLFQSDPLVIAAPDARPGSAHSLASVGPTDDREGSPAVSARAQDGGRPGPAPAAMAAALEIESLEQYLQLAETHHPQLQAARMQLEVAQTRVRSTRKESLPTLDWAAQFSRDGSANQGVVSNRSDVTTTSVTLTVPLSSPISRSYKVAGALAQVEQATQQLEDVRHQVMAEIARNYSQSSLSRVTLEGTGQLVQAAELAMNSVLRRYYRNAADLIEVLTAQSNLADAQAEWVRARVELVSSRARLVGSASLLSRQDLLRLSQYAERVFAGADSLDLPLSSLQR